MLPRFLLIGPLLLAACSPALATEGPEPVAAATDTQAPVVAADTENPTATQTPTATETPPANLIRVGDLELVPFAPPWFEGDLATVVFAENSRLLIDAPASPYEPGDTENVFNTLYFGALTLERHADFDISVTFNMQGGACTGFDKCANLAVETCIAFGFLDAENFQIACIRDSGEDIVGFGGYWFIDAYHNGIISYTSGYQRTETIRIMGRSIFQYAEHPEPNEFRLKMQDNILYGYINGQQVFERQGGLPQACQNLKGVLACSQGAAGEPCDYSYMEGESGQTPSGCSDLVGKIGVACSFSLPASIAAENVAQFGFGIGWDVSNCEPEVALN